MYPLKLSRIRCAVIFLVSIIGVGLYYTHANRISSENDAPIKTHASMYYYDNVDFFPQSVETFASTKPLSPTPRIFMVNQHVLAAHIIAKQFALATDPDVETVVLITQNNWNTGRSPIITSRYGWKTSFGTSSPALSLADVLTDNKIAFVEEGIFSREHGVTGIIPYITHAFPSAKVIPLVIRDTASNDRVDSLADALSKLDLQHTVIVGSIDMSHYLPRHIADAHDRMALQSIQAFDYDMLSRLDIDTVPTLRVLLKVAEHAGLTGFIKTGGMNSASIVGDPNLMETTSYMSGYFTRDDSGDTDDVVHTLFTGYVPDSIADQDSTDAFAKIERLFLGTHAAFFGTESGVRNATLPFRGIGGVVSHDRNQNDFFPIHATATRKTVCLVVSDGDTSFVNVRKANELCDRVVVYVRWMDVFTISPSAMQRAVTHAFVDAGADVVVGMHKEGVQPIEVYGDGIIFHSLGNFAYDTDAPEYDGGLAVHIEWGDTSTHFTIVPIAVRETGTVTARAEERNKILSAVVREFPQEAIARDILESQSFIHIFNKYYGTIIATN